MGEIGEALQLIPDSPGDLLATDVPEERDAYDYAFDPTETVLRQLPGETDYRFEMLKRVAEMPPDQRTSRQVGEVLGIHPTNVRRARSQWRWTERLREVEAAKARQSALIMERALADAASELGQAMLATASLARKAAERIDPETVSPSSMAQLLGATARAMELLKPAAGNSVSHSIGAGVPQDPPRLPTTNDRSTRMARVLADRPDLLEHYAEICREADRLRPS